MCQLTQFDVNQPIVVSENRISCADSCLSGMVEADASVDFRNPCVDCPAGMFVSNTVTLSCQDCPRETFNPSDNATECTSCLVESVHATTGGLTGQATCDHFRWITNTTVLIVVPLCILVCYILCFVAAGEHSVAVVVNMIIPMFDHITDTFYVMNEPFYDYYLFVAACCFLVAPCAVFLWELCEQRDWPIVCRLGFGVWLEAVEGKPTFRGQRIGVSVALPLCCMWPLCIMAQLVSATVELCLWFVGAVILLLWFVVGSFLYNSRMLSVGKIRRLWFFVWRGFADSFEDNLAEVDVAVLNRALFSGFLLESLPQLTVQIYNGASIGNAGTFAIVSISFSVAMTLMGLHKFGYWRFVRGYQWDEIPVMALLPPQLRLVKGAASTNAVPERKVSNSVTSGPRVSEVLATTAAAPTNLVRDII